MPKAVTLARCAAILAIVLSSRLASAQTPPPPATSQAQTQPTDDAVRHLTIDDAVKLALEQNLGIRIQRLDPQIQDVGVVQARSFWAPNFSSTLSRNIQNQPSTARSRRATRTARSPPASG